MHSKSTDLSNGARDIFSIITHGVGVEVSFSIGRDVIGWRKLKLTSETLHNNFSARQYSQPNNILLGGDHKALNTRNTENDSEM
jgi:hypothetical protein